MYDTSHLIRSSDLNPTMSPASQASVVERKFLQSLIRDHYTGNGEIVELGVGGGGTAFALCLGLDRNQIVEQKNARINLFDWFEIGPNRYGSRIFFRDKNNAKSGASFEPDVRENLKGYSDFVIIHNCDIIDSNIRFGNIEVLHIDIAKTLETFCAVFHKYMCSCDENSVILHQDFASPSLSWIHYSTAALLDYIEILGPPVKSTVAFKYIRSVPGWLREKIKHDKFDREEKIELIKKLKEKFSWDHTNTIPYSPILDMSCGFVELRANEIERARIWAEKIENVPYIREKRMDHLQKLKTGM